MKLNVFVSYSSKDKMIVEQLAASPMPHAEFYYWSKSEEPGKEAWVQIKDWIAQCDLFVVVITGHTVQRGLSVGKEVGIARQQGKRILPLVCTRVPASEITFLEGIPYEPIDLFNPDLAIQRILSAIADLYEKKRLEQEMLTAQRQHIQAREESLLQMQQFKVAIAVVAVIIGIILLSKET